MPGFVEFEANEENRSEHETAPGTKLKSTRMASNVSSLWARFGTNPTPLKTSPVNITATPNPDFLTKFQTAK